MTAFENDIVALIRGAITGEKPTLSPDADLARIYRFGKEQQILYMLNTGLCMTDGFEESEAAPRFLQAACAVIAHAFVQQQELEKIRATFSQRGIIFMPLKGTLMRALYPVPEMREMGDADFLICEEQEEKIAETMRSLGYSGTVHEVVWQKPNALLLELPHTLFAPKHADLHAYFEAYDIWAHAEAVCGSEYRMTAEDTFAFDFLHFVKHFRTGGAGLRNVVDLWLFRRAHPTLDEKFLCARFDALGCLEFYHNVCALIDCWFGAAAATEMTDRITSLLFAGGIYGDEQTAERTMHARYHAQYRFAGAASWLHTACPPLVQQKRRYPILNKAPFLLPFTWVWHGIVVLICRPTTIRQVTEAAMVIERDADNNRFDELAAVGLKVTADSFSKR